MSIRTTRYRTNTQIMASHPSEVDLLVPGALPPPLASYGGGRFLPLVARGDPPGAGHPVDDHVLEAVDRLLEAKAHPPARVRAGLQTPLHALDRCDVLFVHH